MDGIYSLLCHQTCFIQWTSNIIAVARLGLWIPSFLPDPVCYISIESYKIIRILVLRITGRCQTMAEGSYEGASENENIPIFRISFLFLTHLWFSITTRGPPESPVHVIPGGTPRVLFPHTHTWGLKMKRNTCLSMLMFHSDTCPRLYVSLPH